MTRQVPTHKKIADEMRRRIIAREYGNDVLPPELVLMDEFDVSRHTIRTALQRLVHDRIIERRAGSGTRIVRASGGGVWAIGSLDDLTGEFMVDQSLTLSARVETVKDFANVITLFGIKPNAKLFHILRILTTNGLPYALSHLFANPAVVKHIPDNELGKLPLVELVQKYGGVRAARARQMATASRATPDVARQLAISESEPVLVMHRTYFTTDDQVLVHAELACRPDRYQQVINFLRENPDDSLP